MQKLKTSLLHKWMNHIDENGNRLSTTEVSLLFHLSMYQDETGLVTGVYHREITDKYQVLSAKSSFYKALDNLISKGLIQIEKNHSSDIDITLLDNDFSDKDYSGGYLSLHQSLFHSPAFLQLTGRNKLLLAELVRRCNLKEHLIEKEILRKKRETGIATRYEQTIYTRTSKELIQDLQSLFKTTDESKTMKERTLYLLINELKEVLSEFITTGFRGGMFTFSLKKAIDPIKDSAKKQFDTYKINSISRRLRVLIPKHTGDQHKNTTALFNQYNEIMKKVPEYNGYTLVEKLLSILYPLDGRKNKEPVKISTRLLHGELRKELKRMNPAFS